MKLPGPLCPMTDDGRHKLKVWGVTLKPISPKHVRAERNARSGFACERCHKTWSWVDDELCATYPTTNPMESN